MNDIAFPAAVLVRVVAGRLGLTEALLYPELSRLDQGPRRPSLCLLRNLRRFVSELPFAELHRRRALPSTGLEIRTVTVSVPPPRRNPAWLTPLTLRFHAVVWPHDDRLLRAYLPELGIEVLARPGDDFDRHLEAEARQAILRIDPEPTLHQLARLGRTGRLYLQAESFTPSLTPPRRRLIDAENAAANKLGVLPVVATRLRGDDYETIHECDDLIASLAETLATEPPRSVLLVGPSGVGKSALFRELVRQRRQVAEGVLADRPFWATSGSRLVAGMSGFGMWQERCRDVVREASRIRAILHLGPLVELMGVGQSECNHVGLAGYLRPHLTRGELLAVCECTPDQLPVIEREDPQLLDAFAVIHVPEPDRVTGRRILSAVAGERITPEAIDLLDRLHRRYATYSAYPGRPLRFVANLLADRPPGDVVTPAEVQAAFHRETGLPRVLLDPAVPLDLAATRHWFGQRVIGQAEALDQVVDLLATVKAGLTRPHRPIASLMFIGPTGVGKTETAKALAEFLFGDRDRLIRFDMSEYADPSAASRLVGVFGREGLLTALVREQPFSVVLLDEFEKAHPATFDLLLQVLGEARLTDAAGRVADFRNTVVILTSNLGAETYRPGGFGFAASTATPTTRAREHFIQAVEAAVRPELFNRIDRVVPFAPLGPTEVRQIAARELEQVRQRDGVRFRSLSLNVDDTALDRLAHEGYDPRYGARPLKRAIERQLLAPLASEINAYDPALALEARVTTTDQSLKLDVRSRRDALGRPLRRQGRGSDDNDLDLCRKLGSLRRLTGALQRTEAARDLADRLFRWERSLAEARRREERGRVARPSVAQLLNDTALHTDRALMDALTSLAQETIQAEDDALVLFYGGGQVPRRDIIDLEKRIQQTQLRLYAHGKGIPIVDAITLWLFGEDREQVLQLARAYHRVARRHWNGGVTQTWFLRLPTLDERAREELKAGARNEWLDQRWYLSGPPEGGPVQLLVVADRTMLAPDSWEPPNDLVGLGIQLRGEAVGLRLEGEDGVHLLRGRQDRRMLVQSQPGDAMLPTMPAGATRRGGFDELPVMRTYNPDGQIDEMAYRVLFRQRSLADALGDLLDLRMQMALWGMVSDELPPNEDDVPF